MGNADKLIDVRDLIKGLSLNEGQRMHIWNEAFAPIEGIHITLSASLVKRAIDVVFYVGECFVIAFDEL